MERKCHDRLLSLAPGTSSTMNGQAIIAGSASGPVLASGEGLSFWGGVDPLTGIVIDAHHPLCGQSIAGKILVMPTTRGSCSGSGVMLDLP